MSFESGGLSAGGSVRRWLDLRLGLKIVAVLVLDFVLLRIAAPDLVNLHTDWALALAVACLIVALAAAVWLALQIRRAVLTSRSSPRRSIASPPTEQENP